jgi:hypothetical protein
MPKVDWRPCKGFWLIPDGAGRYTPTWKMREYVPVLK